MNKKESLDIYKNFAGSSIFGLKFKTDFTRIEYF